MLIFVSYGHIFTIPPSHIIQDMEHNFNAPEEFLREETRNGYAISKKIKKVWACQINLLCEFQKVCERHSLKFYLDSGTLLGAVRHKGFIPWDDDIDVVMLREDYDKLLKIAEREFQSPYIFQTAYNQKNFVRGHAQLRDGRTCAMIPSELRKKFNQGIFIDIFVLDYIPEDPVRYSHVEYWTRRTRIRLERIAAPGIEGDGFREKLKTLNYKVIYASHWAFCRLYSRYEDIVRKSCPDGSRLLSPILWFWKAKKLDADIFSSTEYAQFEWLQFPIPSGYDKMLRTYYGDDYMTPKMNSSRHGEVIFDPERPAKEVIAELKEQEK